MAMPEPEPRSWPNVAISVVFIVVVLGVLAAALITGLSAMVDQMNKPTDFRRPTPSVAGTR
jgi:hypothetical protein